MKTQSTVLYVLRISLTLLLITAVVAGALAAVNHITAPIIAAAKEAKLQAAVGEVLHGGGEEIPFDKAANPLVSAVYASEAGYAVQVQPAGFGGAITMMVGVDKAGNVRNIAIVSHTETAGLGDVAAKDNDAGNAFRGQFAGLSGTLAVTKDGGTVDAITGATITSRAVTAGVNAALACVGTLG